ncbi:MAG: hypothetical protein K8T90_09430 [Planctomycetes bacterium]|nr:hypothetical protein [Planctomycetota bacterium]
MRAFRLLLSFGVVWALAGSPAPLADARADVSIDEMKKAVAGFRAYLRATDDAGREKAWKSVAAVAAKLSAKEVEDTVRAATPGDAWKAGFVHGVEFRSLGEIWTYSALVPKERPKGLVPLVLDPGHGSFTGKGTKDFEGVMETWLDVSGARNDVVYVRTNAIEKLTADKRYDAWATPRRKPDEPNLDSVATVLLDAVRDASLRWPIDPDRVHVQGISQTGFWAWWLGQHAPDRWASVAPVGAVTFHVRKLLGNVVPVPVFVLHGTADPTCPFAQAKGAADDLKAAGGTVDFRPTEGGKHMEGVFPRFGEIWPLMAAKVRDPYPKSFTHDFVGGARGDAFWLRAADVPAGDFNPFGPAARVTGTIDGQTVRVTSEHVAKLDVLLATPMLDFTKSVRIELNGKKAFEGKLTPDPRAALDCALRRGDGRTFAATVSLRD